MKNSKKILSVFLTLAMMLSLMPMALAAESSYQDTEGHWAEAAIERWSGFGVIQGNNGNFNPNNSLTRGHMAAVLSRLLNLPDAPDAGFTDVKDGDWYAEYINKCAAAGIMLGSDGKANPNAPITRQQAIVMLGRALGIQPVENPDLSHFQDGTAISDYAKGYVAAMNEAGIVGGITSDTLGGGSDITRAQTVTILNRAIGTYANEAGATVAASSSGITLVAADNVTVTGTADSVLVSQGVSDGAVTLSSSSAGSVTVTAENATVYVSSESKADDVTLTTSAVGSTVVVEKGAQVGTVTTEAPKSTVSVSGTVETVTTTATAEKASVEVSKTATVGEIAASGEKTAIAVSGKVENVTVSDTATDTTVKANSGSTISKVDNAAEGTTVSGSGKVENVTTSGDNTTVSTPGTKVEADKGTTGTTAGNKDVAGGSSTTTPSGSTSSGSSGGGSSHSHSYTATVTKAATCVEAGIMTYTCSCGASYTEAIPATGVHTYAYADNSNGTHTGTCSVCGTKVENEPHTAGDTAACTKCGAEIVAKVGTTGYTDLQAALNVGGEVVLLKDIITPTKSYYVRKNVTLDLNGKTLSGSGYDGTLCVPAAVTLTINGDGNVIGNDDNEYGMAVWGCEEGANIIINGGSYSNTLNHADDQMDMIYLSDGADAVINGGTFKCTTPKWTLNIKDANYADNSSTFTVTGGTFYQYNPANAKSESPDAKFVPEGYSTMKKDADWYEVLEGIYVSDADGLRAAINNGGTVYLYKDIDLTTVLEIGNSVVIDGKGHNINNTANRVIRITAPSLDVKMYNLGIISKCTAGSDVRGISFDDTSSNTSLLMDGCTVSASFYAINMITGPSNLNITIKDGTVAAGWAAINCYANNSTFTIENSTLRGLNDKGESTWNDFATIVFDGNGLWNADNVGVNGSNNTMNITNSTIYASSESSNNQAWLAVQYGALNETITVDANTKIIDASNGDQSENIAICPFVGPGNGSTTFTNSYDTHSQLTIGGDTMMLCYHGEIDEEALEPGGTHTPYAGCTTT